MVSSGFNLFGNLILFSVFFFSLVVFIHIIYGKQMMIDLAVHMWHEQYMSATTELKLTSGRWRAGGKITWDRRRSLLITLLRSLTWCIHHLGGTREKKKRSDVLKMDSWHRWGTLVFSFLMRHLKIQTALCATMPWWDHASSQNKTANTNTNWSINVQLECSAARYQFS